MADISRTFRGIHEYGTVALSVQKGACVGDEKLAAKFTIELFFSAVRFGREEWGLTRIQASFMARDAISGRDRSLMPRKSGAQPS